MTSLSPELDQIIRQNIKDESTYETIRDIITRHHPAETRQSSYLSHLHRLATGRYDSLKSMFASYLRVGCEALDIDAGNISYIDDGLSYIQQVHPPSSVKLDGIPVEQLMCHHVIQQQETVALNHISTLKPSSKPYHEFYKNTECYIGTPIYIDNTVWGVMCFYSDRVRTTDFTRSDIEFVELMAQSIGSALNSQNIQRQQQLAEERYHLIFENIDTPIIMYDVDSYQIIDVNSAATEFYGYTRDEFLAMSMIDINMLPPADIEARIARSKAIERPFTRFPHRLKLGEIREVEDYASDMVMDNRHVRFSFIYDYSDRHEAEEALKHSEANLRAVFDNTSQLMFLVDETANIIAMNRAAIATIELTHGERPQIGDTTIHTYHPPSERYLVSEYVNRALHGEIISHDVLIQLSNDQPLYLSYRYVPVKTPTDEIIGVCVTAQDITSLKLSQEELARERNILRALIDNVPDVIYIKDAEARILTANRRYLQVARVNTIDDVLGKTDQAFFGERGEQSYQDDLAVIESDKITNKDKEVILPDDTRGIFSTTKIPLHDREGNVIGLVGVGHDITKQRAIEQGLRDNEEKFNQLITHIPEAFWIFDVRDQRIIYASDNYQKMFGISLEDRQQDVNRFLDQVHPEDRQLVSDNLNRQSLGETSQHEARFVNDEKQTRWLSIRIYPVRNEDGTVHRVAGIASDITRQKQAEKDKLEMMAQQERITILSKFFRDASHEFKTPLSVINTSLYILGKSDNPQTRQHHHALIHEQVRGISELVEALVLMSRLDSRAELTFSAVNLNAIMRQINNHIRDSYTDRVDDFRIDLDEALPPVIGHLNYITQAVKNLVDNAIRYSSPGDPIELRTYHEKGFVIIEVKDYGIGIKESELPEIFKRFYRGDEAHSTRGFGLGLPVARSIAQRHGGDILVESVAGQSSTFKLQFPVIQLLND